MAIEVAQLVGRTRAEGPGSRFAIWVQGCPLRCPGCCNPEMFSARGGHRLETAELMKAIAAEGDGVEGISLLGGEPFAQARGCAELAGAARASGLSVVVFSGYRLDELETIDGAGELLAQTDLLFDGRYDRDRPDTRRRWVGSTNQVAHFLTDRYRAGDPQFLEPDTVEIRFVAGKLQVNGWPAAADRLVRRR